MMILTTGKTAECEAEASLIVQERILGDYPFSIVVAIALILRLLPAIYLIL